jgi:ABC-2 type transport system ATP-binding protein
MANEYPGFGIVMNPINVQSLSKTFSSKEGPVFRKVRKSIVAVDDISFNVPEGEVFALLGPNGAGKATTIKTIESEGRKQPTS